MNYKGLIRVIDSQETASIKEARRLLVEKVGKTEEEADKWVRGDLRAAFPILRDKHAAKFILGTTRLFVDQELNNADAQNKLTRILKEVNSEGNYEKYDRNLNGLSLNDLFNIFKGKIESDDQASREASKGKTYSKSEYEITGPFDTFEKAEAAWGNDSQDWCVFHMEDMFDSYTSAGQVFYVAAKHGWKSVPREEGEDVPKDDYGNSLIAISVDRKGNLATSTPRWNHANGGSDNTYSVDELESILQVSFYDTFVPMVIETVVCWGDGDLVKVVKYGSSYRYMIGADAYTKVAFSKLFSMRDGKLIPKFEMPLGVMNDDSEDNYLSPDGHLISDEWFMIGEPFSDEGFAAVLRDINKYSGPAMNYIDVNGNYLSDEWFSRVFRFNNGAGCVVLNNKCNYIKPDGSFLSKVWFDSGTFMGKNGIAEVRYGGKDYYINLDGVVTDVFGRRVVLDSVWKRTMGLLKKV